MKNKLSLCEPITYTPISDLILAPQKAVEQEAQLQPIKTGYLALGSRHGTMSNFTEVRKSIMPLGKVGLQNHQSGHCFLLGLNFRARNVHVDKKGWCHQLLYALFWTRKYSVLVNLTEVLPKHLLILRHLLEPTLVGYVSRTLARLAWLLQSGYRLHYPISYLSLVKWENRAEQGQRHGSHGGWNLG